MTTYSCKACGAPVEIMTDGLPRRACDHHAAGICAHLRAHATGEGGACAPRPTLSASIARAFAAVLAAFRRA